LGSPILSYQWTEKTKMRNGFRLGKLFGIDIVIDYSWVLVFVLITWSLAEHYLVVHQEWSAALRWLLAVLTSLLFFASVLAHEMAHSLVSKSQGIPVPRITLFIFGGASQISEEPRRAIDEFWMALVGPLTSLALAAVFGVLWFTTQQFSPEITEVSGWLAGINLTLAIFNLVPGFPLDGGRVLRATIWGISKNLRLATQVAVGGGVVVSWLMIGIGLWQVVGGDWANGLWIAFIGWFLQSAAVQEGQVTVVHDILKGHKVREALELDCPHVLKQLSLDVFVEGVAIPSGKRCFVVMDGDKFLGLLTLRRLAEIPRSKWGSTRVADVMVMPDKLITAQLDDDLSEVLERMGRADINQLPVLADGKLLGIVTRANLIAFLRAHADRQGLGVKPG
jgi:Zn-dependent protease/CBS domain-containing protein